MLLYEHIFFWASLLRSSYFAKDANEIQTFNYGFFPSRMRGSSDKLSTNQKVGCCYLTGMEGRIEEAKIAFSTRSLWIEVSIAFGGWEQMVSPLFSCPLGHFRSQIKVPLNISSSAPWLKLNSAIAKF